MSRPDAPIIEFPEHRAIYVAIQKVASSSLLKVAAQLLGLDMGKRGPHGTFHDHPWIQKDALRGYEGHWKFSFVRNPWDRLVSCHASKIEGSFHHGFERFRALAPGMPFDAFARAIVDIPDSVTDPHLRSQYCFITDADGELLVDFVGRFERLAEDFRQVCDRIGAGDVALPHEKKTRRRDYRGYYSPELIEIVGERYAADIDRFGYAF
ncbi:MAG: hypothetical protein CMJ83_08630 [Planctomycetes bacterium]|nr:hypothetical protein [Planctomycetota bacterium]